MLLYEKLSGLNTVFTYRNQPLTHSGSITSERRVIPAGNDSINQAEEEPSVVSFRVKSAYLSEYKSEMSSLTRISNLLLQLTGNRTIDQETRLIVRHLDSSDCSPHHYLDHDPE